MDYTTGQILTAGNEHQQRNPASLTKLMTGYVVDRAIDSHRITPDDIVTVGRDAWAKDNPVFVGSSLMFLKEGDRVSVRDLSRGLMWIPEMTLVLHWLTILPVGNGSLLK